MNAKRLHPWAVAGLSWALPGLGQHWLGRFWKGLLLLISFVLLRGMAWGAPLLPFISSMKPMHWLFFLSRFIPYIFCILAGLDALICAKRVYANDWQPSDEKTWFAVFLSLIWPGLGHAYAKRWSVFVFLSVFYILLVSANSMVSGIGLIILRIGVCFHIGRGFIDATEKRVFRKFIICISLILFVINIAIPVLRQRYIITGGFAKGLSMEPTINDGDLVLTNRLVYVFYAPRVGDIVQIDGRTMKDRVAPSIRSLLTVGQRGFVKRIVAIGGDTIHIKEEGLYINGALQDSFAIDYGHSPKTLNVNGSRIERLATTREFTIPENCFFVLGDNVKDSLDSRDFGAVPKDMIKGKVVYTPTHCQDRKLKNLR